MIPSNTIVSYLRHLVVVLTTLAMAACGAASTSTGDGADTGGDTVAASEDATPEPESDATPEPESDAAPEPESDAAPEPESDAAPEPESDAGPVVGDDVVETADVEEPTDPIGEPMGDPQSIDHAMVKAALDAHVQAHMDGLGTSVKFLETSDALNNLVEILFGEDDDEGDEGDEEEEDDEPMIQLDLSGLGEDILSWLADYVVVESTATSNEDGTVLTYHFTPEVFCASEDSEGEMSEEEMNEQVEDEAKCTQQITDSPLNILVSSDGGDRLHITMTAGTDNTEVFVIQLHDDMLAGFVHLAGVRALLETFIDAEDFEFPATMTGTVGVEVQKEAELQYTLRVVIEEALQMVPAAGQETLALMIEQQSAPGGLTIDGNAGVISGSLDMSQVHWGMAWQMVVDIFWDDEGSMEMVCTTNPDTGTDDCSEEWVDGPESPPVEGNLNLLVPGVTGSITIDSATDLFHFAGLSLGEAAIVADVDGEPILQVELNPEAGWSFGLKMIGDDAHTTRFEMTPAMDARVVMSMDHVKDGLQDPPEFMLADTMGVRMDGADLPSMKLMRDEEDEVDIQVASGQLTLWSDAMDDDVVIEAGQCIGHDDEGLTEEEKDALHGLFGGLFGGSCDE